MVSSNWILHDWHYTRLGKDSGGSCEISFGLAVHIGGSSKAGGGHAQRMQKDLNFIYSLISQKFEAMGQNMDASI